ncbi:C-type lectin-like isoform X2 [Neocloeon triangulifer]|uniref:C-type lectin-like isoform X2 n=1 Tax=Neocloeon triangulifer TaxID=2078957 RepID=UPI00286F18A2|nr:C-type lectin-like isoform X2 [Neocloeon triangulifer]
MRLLFILQLQLSIVRGRDFVINGRHYCLEEKSKVTWTGADLTCLAKSMSLVSFETEEEFFSVVSYLNGTEFYNMWIWTSGMRRALSEIWTWDSTDGPIATDHWGKFQPNLPVDAEGCINFLAQYNHWDDDPCDSLYLAVMCEGPEIIPIPKSQ